MGKVALESPLLVDSECQVNSKISRINEDYIALPGSSATAAAEAESLGSASEWRNRSGILVISICCIAAILISSAAFVSYGMRSAQNGYLDRVLEGRLDADFEKEWFAASKTAFHFQPEKNFMSDPNAPFFYMGYYHFFYQYNPHGAVWGDIAWGHTASKDLLNWIYLDMILIPDQWYDIDGSWSGSATLLKDGSPVILYTGGRQGFGADAKQSTNMALPVDPSDPLLREWTKVDMNPILLNPDFVRPQDFRDPTTAWLEDDGLWRLAMGSRRDNPDGTRDGIALMYTSVDFMNWPWKLEETYLHRVQGTGMWECLDLFPILIEGKKGVNHSVLRAEHYYSGPYKYVLKVSVDETRHDHYTVGSYSTETHKFTPDDPAIDAGIGMRYDYGKFYASKTFYDPTKTRRVLWGYANESDSITNDVVKGWAGVQSIPRTLWLDPLTQKYVLQWPVEEVKTLRGARKSMKNFELQPTDVVKIPGADGPQLDILVAFKKPDVNMVDEDIRDEFHFDCKQDGSAERGPFGPFGLLVRADKDLLERTAIFFYISHLDDGRWATRVCSDQSKSSLWPEGLDKSGYGSQLKVLEVEDELHLRILVDHSMVETFVQGGKFVLTSRVYPTLAFGAKSHSFLFNNSTRPIMVKRLDVYQMGSVTMTSI